jgi:hypothetical protein
MDMPEFMRICVEQGLIFDEEDFKKENEEACQFLFAHPLFDKPKVIAVFCDYMEDDESIMRVFAPKISIICHNDFTREVLYSQPQHVSGEDLVSAIESIKKLCDEELELQNKGTELTTKQLSDYLLYTLGNNAKIKLNCSIRELVQSPIGKSLDIQSV